ncbi:MAG TPA: hypothetical protein DCE71_05765 [Parachlamydiales bacterium]|nr:hypothetical protein [Parachlamydiales bacterium]
MRCKRQKFTKITYKETEFKKINIFLKRLSNKETHSFSSVYKNFQLKYPLLLFKGKHHVDLR